VGAGGDDDRVGLEVAVVGLDREPVVPLVDVLDRGAEVDADTVLLAGGVDERLRDRAVVDDIAVRCLERLERRGRVAALDDLRL